MFGNRAIYHEGWRQISNLPRRAVDGSGQDETADVGIDNQTPVAEGIGIGPDTRFTGTINKVTLEVRK